jgi:phage terminase large subunit-like protein
MVPDVDLAFPTLGPALCEWIEANLVFGPGDLRGQQAQIDDEKRALLCRMYEVYPKDHPQAGRRRFKRCGISVRKGSAKTEFAAWVAAAELHPDAPVRCVDWRYDKKARTWEPIGGGVTDPYIPLVAYTEEQSEDLAYGALRAILSSEACPIRSDFDIGLERIMRKAGDGKAVALATAPDARDGARTTFQHFDETHRFTLPRLVKAHQAMLANIPKRRLADAWSLETTTAPEPGTGSVAEATMEYARSVASGVITDSRLFFFHREAGSEHDITTEEGVRAAVLEASGPVAVWSDIDSIVDMWRDPTTDRSYFERVWLNRLVKASSQAFDVEAWKKLAAPNPVKDGALIVIGFDGAQTGDSTALVAEDVFSGYQWLAGLWEKPTGLRSDQPWRVPAADVDEAVRALFKRFKVWRMYADPPYWQEWVAKWAGEFGEDRVIEWYTNRRRQMSAALENYDTAIREGSIHHDGNKDLARHIGNARRLDLPWLDEQGKHLWLIQKERPDSPFKIDAAMASVLCREARTDAIKSGVKPKPANLPVFFLKTGAGSRGGSQHANA